MKTVYSRIIVEDILYNSLSELETLKPTVIDLEVVKIEVVLLRVQAWLRGS